MTLLLDDNLPAALAADLRGLGLQALTLTEAGVAAVPTTVLMRVVYERRAVLLSLDDAIADTRRFPPGQYAGLVLVRLASAGRNALRTGVLRHSGALGNASLAGRLWILTDAGFNRSVAN